MPDELWKSVQGYEGLYEVSNLGRVRSARRQGSQGMIIKTRKCNKGYDVVSLCKTGKYHTALVHRLVAQSFIENPNSYPCVNHKDENKGNNHADNLEWCSYSYNNVYGTGPERRVKARYKQCVGTWPDGTERYYQSCTIASRETGIAQGNIWGACNGLWKHAGGITWRYCMEEHNAF